MTKREQIMVEVQARLAAVAAVTGCTGAYRCRADQYDRDEAPAITLSWITEDARSIVVPFTEKTLTIEVGVYTRGTGPDTLGDPIIDAVHKAIFADRTLAGLAIDVTEAGDTLDVSAADATAAMTVKQYAIWYRHTMEDMSA